MCFGQGEKDSKEEILKAFRLFDDDETGKISLKNLRRVAKEIGENMTDEELQEMITEADRDGDGEINEEEYACSALFLSLTLAFPSCLPRFFSHLSLFLGPPLSPVTVLVLFSPCVSSFFLLFLTGSILFMAMSSYLSSCCAYFPYRCSLGRVCLSDSCGS